MHAAFEARNHDIAEMEGDYERHRQALYLRKHDTLDGYQAAREFPCPGVLRTVDQTETHRIVACDVCRYETTCRPAGAAAASQEW